MPEFPRVAGFTLVEQIGGGGFSTVYKSVNFETQRAAACKVVTLTESTTEKERKGLDKETKIHTALKHINVLEFLGVVIVDLKHKASYYPGYYMLMELAGGGDLFDKIAPDVGVSDQLAHLFFGQLIAGMEYIHQQGICHRDLKPENLLLNGATTLKISDFGLSSVYKLKTGQTRTLSERCGSLPYVAPELNSMQPYEAEPIDVWGCGVILFTLLVGNTPWDEPTKRSPEFYRYLKGTIFDEEPWNRISDQALSLLKGMLAVDPAERLTLEEVSQHPWCMRPSQIASLNPIQIAEMLTSELRANGDLDIAAPPTMDAMDVDPKDPLMTPVTQKLQLFSQTPKGVRYCPNLTRFYTTATPPELLPLIQASLEEMNVQCRLDQRTGSWVLRIGGTDARKQIFKGWVNLEYYEIDKKYLPSSHPLAVTPKPNTTKSRSSKANRDDEDEDYFMDEDSQDTIIGNDDPDEEEEEDLGPPVHGSFVSMARDEGNPISWRRLWRDLIRSERVKGHVLLKKGKKL